jgi:predicted ATPase/class 3 adenylate cyclase
MNCADCNADIPEGARFCPQCGRPVAARCPACGTNVAAVARFCHNCGASVASARPAPAPAPRQPADDAALVERRQLTVMFCDLVGSVQLSHALDPEDLRDVVRDYRDACSTVVARYGGTTAQFQGDGILVYFGYPVAHEDDARRSVQAGLEILEAVGALATRMRAERGVTLSVRVAAHTGLTLVGDLGGAAGTERLALGDTPNLAARIQQLAEPDTLVVSLATHRLVSGFFETTSLGTHRVKGLDEPVEIFQVHAASGARHRLEAASPQRLAPYVGRENAIAELVEAWLRARDSPGHAVLLQGEPGVGKSRLLSVFRERIGGDSCDIIECYCSPYYDSTAFYPVVAPLRARMDLVDDESPPERLARLRTGLDAHGCEIETALPLVAQLFGISPDAGYQPLGLHPLTQKQKTVGALLSLLTARASERETLLVVEDLHWVDPTTLELLGALVARLPANRLLLLMTSRPGFAPPWPGGDSLTVLHVNQLSAADTETLIRRVVGDKPLPPQVMSLLVEKTDGNPLYVEEMTRMFLDSGTLRETATSYELAGPLPDLMVPASLHDLLMARLDRMPPEAKKVVQLGAAIGREWSFELLCQILPGDEQLLGRGLEQLLRDGFVFTTSTGFAIKHALIQDAAYESLLKRTRGLYHERIAQALERGATGGAHPERIAQHWTKAGQPAKAVPYWLEAGRLAVASSATAEAESHLRHGLELIGALPESSDRDRLELALLSTLGVALTIQKGWAAPEVAEGYARAQALSERVGPNPQLFWVLWGMWAFYLVKGDQAKGYEFAQRMMGIAAGEADESLALEANFALGLSLYYMGDLPAARDRLEAAVAAYVPERHHSNAFLTSQDVGVTARSVASMVLYLRGETELALERERDAVALASRLKHPFSQAYALGCAAWLDAYRQAPEAMAARATETIEVSTAQALGFWLVWGSIFAGRAIFDAGETTAGAKHIEEALSTYRGIGSGMVVPYFLALLAEVEAANGDAARALSRLDEARRLIEAGGEAFMAAEIERLDGEIRRAGGGAKTREENVAIERLFRRAHDIAERQGNRIFALRAATSLASMLAARGERIEARQRLVAAIEAIPGRTETPDLARARDLLQSIPAPASAAA